MHIKTFETEISQTIQQRGKSYYNDGAVTDLQDMENGQYFAIVEGSDDYQVDLRLSDEGEVLSYSCNCPYDGEICKHIVAVLYQVREEVPFDKTSKKTKKQNPWQNIISVVPEEELRNFVKEYAAKNQDFRNVLMIRFVSYDNMDNRDKYSNILNGIFSAAGDRHGFIDYNHMFGTMQQVFDLLAKGDKYFEQGNYKEAFYIAAAVAPSCIDAIQIIDDSDGECGGAINDAFEIISKIFNSDAAGSLKNEAFNWLLGEAENPDYDNYGCAGNLFPCLVDAIDSPEKATSVLAFFDNQVIKATSIENWSREYHTKHFLELKMDVLKKIGQGDKAKNIITDNIHIHDFRKIVVEKCLAENNSNEAVRLIKEGINIATDGDYEGAAIDWKEMLMEIYKKQGQVKELRVIAKELYYSDRYEMKYYHEYKSTFRKEEWGAELDKIIDHHTNEKKGRLNPVQTIPSNLAAIYIEENMQRELFCLLQKNATIHSLIEYSQHLIPDYAPELIPLYKNAIEWLAERASDRRMYHEIASYILRMSKIPRGKEPARILAEHLVEKYNKRPAMKDELKKCLTINHNK